MELELNKAGVALGHFSDSFQFSSLASFDTQLTLLARNLANLQHTKNMYKSAGAKVVTVVGDVSKQEDCLLLIDTAIKTFGAIGYLINNAGISMCASFDEIDTSVHLIK
jgi:NADP-dependent 3-hydroxy acid dehydrogenase YdfG